MSKADRGRSMAAHRQKASGNHRRAGAKDEADDEGETGCQDGKTEQT